MGSYMMKFGRRENADVRDYEDAGKTAKKGLAMIMEAIDNDDLQSAKEGMEMAWEGVKTMCEISNEMKQQYGERRYNNRGGMNYRHDDWNERDDDWMERRMRDSRGRFM